MLERSLLLLLLLSLLFSTMGGGNSKESQLSLEQRDIKYLGERFPFGDAELFRLYRCYQAMIHPYETKNNHQRESFLSDLAYYCTVLPPSQRQQDEDVQVTLDELRQRRVFLVRMAEEKILPAGFGERLEKVAFLRLQQINKMVNDQEEEECARLERLESFFEGVANGGRRGGRAALGALFQCFVDCNAHPSDLSRLCHPDGTDITADAKLVLDAAYRLSLAAAFLHSTTDEERADYILPSHDTSHDKIMEALVQSLLEFVRRKKLRDSPYGTLEEKDEQELQRGVVSKISFLEWSESNAPLLSSTLPTFLHQIFFADKAYPPSRTPFVFPKILEESAFFDDPASTMLFSFATMSSSLGGAWHRLYTSTCDGLSFNRLQNSLLGYGGPTLIIIQATGSGGMFGAFTSSPWKESKDFYGTSDCFLYQLLPLTAVYRPCGSGQNFQYCNSEARSRGYDGLAHGIGFGGDSEQPRLFIAESFDGCVASSQDLTFDNGPLLPRSKDGTSLQNKYFEIDNLEVWGVGGDTVVAEALNLRDKQREVTAANIRKARKVDKAAFLDDFRTGIIESKAFKHRDQIRGRADAEVDERDQNNYVYEK